MQIPIALLSAWRALREHFQAGTRVARIVDTAGLGRFLDSRASYVAQTSLYGYLRTRAGTRYPELFARPEFLASMNAAKWQLWLACVSDLAVYSGGLVAARTGAGNGAVTALMQQVLGSVLAPAGAPPDAGPEFAGLAGRVRQRVAACDWGSVADDATVFVESPAALVRWAPVADELKSLDEEIVRNSVRFRWQEVRQDLRRDLDASAVLADLRDAGPGSAGGGGD